MTGSLRPSFAYPNERRYRALGRTLVRVDERATSRQMEQLPDKQNDPDKFKIANRTVARSILRSIAEEPGGTIIKAKNHFLLKQVRNFFYCIFKRNFFFTN